MVYNMKYTALELGTAEFRVQTSTPKLRSLLAEHPVVTVGRYKDEPAAVVVDPAMFAELLSDHVRLEQLQDLLPLLVTALAAGAAIPSTTLDRLGIELPDRTWQTLNELQHHVPVHLALGEHGEAVARGRLSSLGPVEEMEEDLILLDD